MNPGFVPFVAAGSNSAPASGVTPASEKFHLKVIPQAQPAQPFLPVAPAPA